MAQHVAELTAQGVLDDALVGMERGDHDSEMIQRLAGEIKDQLEELAGYLDNVGADDIAPEDVVALIQY